MVAELQTTPDETMAWGNSGRVGIWQSARRHKLLALLPLLLFLGAAVFVGLARGPAYTAESRLIVGRLDITAPGALAGFEQATQSLAAAYSRAVVADAVVDPVSQDLRLSPATIRARTLATPIQDANVFKIRATGPDGRSAVALANAMTSSLIAYVLRLNRTNPDSERLLRQFRQAALDYQNKFATEQRLDRRASRTQSLADQRAANVASAQVQQALLQRETYRIGYQNSQSGQSSSSQIQVLAPAAGSSSDRTSILELLILGALVAGTVVGLALAALRANSARARARAA